MRPMLVVLLLTCAFLKQVSAHGFVHQISIDGKWYAGNEPGGESKVASPIRLISDGGPLQLDGSNAVDFVCGKNASSAQISAEAKAGSSIAFKWVGVDGTSAWIHRVGPLLTYMTPCGTGDCNGYEPTVDTNWFKIAELGQLPSDTSLWYQEAISTAGAIYTLQLPGELPAGDYLIRHEMVSLQNGIVPNGIEFYPMCVQLHVDGGGMGLPNVFVTFPDTYNSSSDGLIFDAYTPPIPTYTFPGGPVSNLAALSQSMWPAAPKISATPMTNSPSVPLTTQNAPTSVAPVALSSGISLPPRCMIKHDTGKARWAKRVLRRLC